MLYSFLISLVDQFSALNVFRYLTFRTGLSVMSSMIIVFLIGGPFIKFIQSHKITGSIMLIFFLLEIFLYQYLNFSK